MTFIDVYITCLDRSVAETIARACVTERLAACANIGSPITRAAVKTPMITMEIANQPTLNPSCW